jgi:hypothetical protein
MTRPSGSLRIPLLALAIVALLVAVALPTLAASPSPSTGAAAAGSEKPERSDKPGKGPKASREPEVVVTLSGVVATTTDADGDTEYTLTVGGKTVRLDAGPSWFFGDKHPLKAFVGKTVTITGEQSGDEVDVETVDGVRLRAEGKPPWAGGWKAVGSAHPGWTQEKWDKWQAKQAAKADKLGTAGTGCWPPGHCKTHGPKASAEAPDPNGG